MEGKENSQPVIPDVGSGLRRNLYRLIAGVVLVLAIGSGCMSRNPAPVQSLQVPTPLITPQYDSSLPTPEIISPMDTPFWWPSVSTKKSYLDGLENGCQTVREYQSNFGVEQTDTIIFSKSLLNNLPTNTIAIIENAVNEGVDTGNNSSESWVSKGKKVFVMYANSSTDTTIAEVHIPSLVCSGSTDPAIIVYPEILEYSDDAQRNIIIHEMGHTFLPENYSIIEGVSVEVNPTSVFTRGTEGFLEITTPEIGNNLTITLVERMLLLTEDRILLDTNGYSTTFEEIMADMFVAVTYMDDDPTLNDFYSIPSGLVYQELVLDFHETLKMNGIDISPRELAYIFVNNSSLNNSLLVIANNLEQYRLTASNNPTDVMISFALANNKTGLSGDAFRNDLLEQFFQQAEELALFNN